MQLQNKELEVTRPKKERQYNKLFGPRVRDLRKLRFPEKTAEEFAELVGITGSYLSNIENSKVPPPSEEVVRAIAKTLGEDTETLLNMAGYVGADVANLIGQVDDSQFEVMKILRLMRGIQLGKTKFTTEQVIAYMLGRSLEEHRHMSSTELLPELIEQAKHLAQTDGEIAEEFLPTIDRGMRVLGEILEKLEEQKLETESVRAKKAKHR
jgi:HTH-type transcriptional regulator, competence development regulator